MNVLGKVPEIRPAPEMDLRRPSLVMHILLSILAG